MKQNYMETYVKISFLKNLIVEAVFSFGEFHIRTANSPKKESEGLRTVF
jgi:hypothetical protein